jgi:hypothetical protein
MSNMETVGVADAKTLEGYFHWDGTDSSAIMTSNASLGLVGTNQMSAMFWATCDDATINEWCAPMGATTSNHFDDGWAFYARNAYDKINFFVEHYTANVVICNDAFPTDGTWFNVCGVYDGSLGSDNLKIYANGVQQTSTDNYTGNITDDGAGSGGIYVDGGVYLGRVSGYPGYFWDGKTGPCMIWNRPLSAEEVLQNYNQLKSRFGL